MYFLTTFMYHVKKRNVTFDTIVIVVAILDRVYCLCTKPWTDFAETEFT